jgi:hypothetical protein
MWRRTACSARAIDVEVLGATLGVVDVEVLGAV